ncbi:E3 ubiquitin-protein ligase rnf168 [Esox lucius]|uniref:RING-type E3 ubiquitin transferase n=1 Tax=Esox lucius TaxID=8010 RepID=A0AAY5K919_ESOLU|nr:E3 ubiquitin-protein ligase rnf168 [Esox lucius]XP_010896825.2 E3 ubiquitin-protein ligase rnf168 [Esox lucius]XP_010896826.2 E3 ubiquitin-protein ligase rnf168 [Esox lucius]XP_010896828.2 E3 ubiquitin-protein ligase rnf168 [Esox lucius]XP_010896829.2 E3 ubiquitin-protein ligase rnf168 [Esox lucius]
MPPISDAEAPMPEGDTAVRLSRADCLCPVCLEILMEPVTLPCQHSFCKPCFLETVDKANMCCPLCRKRVSTWARLNSRNKTLVNEELWRQVQAAFPVQCQRRLSGQEEEEEENMLVPRPKVSLPGEVRREYEDQICKLAEEKRALEEAERKASEQYIQHLLAEEEERQAEERRRDEERQLENDEKLAKLLSQELNPSPISESQKNRRPTDTPAKKRTNTNAGDIEKFLIPQRHSSVSDKENISHMETNRWSPKEQAECPMPLLDFYGSPENCPMLGKATTSESVTHHPTNAGGISLAQALPHGTPAKRKSCVIEESNEGDRVSKQSCPSSSSSSSSLYLPYGQAELVGDAHLFQELAQREEVLFSRRQQEEKDRQLALQLQKQLNREEALRAVDRRKGSCDQYQLRQKSQSSQKCSSSMPRRAPSHSSSHKEDRVSVKRRQSEASCTATRRESLSPSETATPSNPLKRGSKQTTLTEMFHSLGD